MSNIDPHTNRTEEDANKEADAIARGELEQIRTKHQQQLRDTLRDSLVQNVDSTREHLVNEISRVMHDAFDNQMKDFVEIEGLLVLNITQRLTDQYRNILSDSEIRIIKLGSTLGSIRDRVEVEAVQVSSSEQKEKSIDAVLVVVAILVSIVFALSPDILYSPNLKYLAAFLLTLLVIILSFYKVALFRDRKSKVEQLRKFVKEKEEFGRSLVPQTDSDTEGWEK